ncbi:hypothetical protein ABZ832_00425 [Streptantibioticus parmotrematis]|uniref:hypothetical protein n=1 Tax=Streptantibioticus parmotrematis TaxID=2873249 RepID=UPI0034021A24
MTTPPVPCWYGERHGAPFHLATDPVQIALVHGDSGPGRGVHACRACVVAVNGRALIEAFRPEDVGPSHADGDGPPAPGSTTTGKAFDEHSCPHTDT